MISCPQCGAIHDGRKWSYGIEAGKGRRDASPWICKPVAKLCPGCVSLKRGDVEGVVTLKGGFFRNHADEVKNLVRHIANRVMKRNVKARIYSESEDDSTLVIETTDLHLAEKIGKEMRKAFKGVLRIDWKEEANFVRVIWERD